MRPPVTWVLLRGLGRESGHWGGFPGRLSQALGPGHRVLTHDLPGMGTRHAERSPYSVAAMAADARERLAAHRADGPLRLVALSLGAMVAIEWARQWPQDLAGCALINTSLPRFSTPWERLRPESAWQLLRLLLAAMWPTASVLAREETVMRLTSARPELHPREAARWAALTDAHPAHAGNVLRQLLAAASFRAPREAPHCPLLLIVSKGDRLVSPRCSKAIAVHWNAPLVEHPWAGHDLPLDDGPWLASRLARWGG